MQEKHWKEKNSEGKDQKNKIMRRKKIINSKKINKAALLLKMMNGGESKWRWIKIYEKRKKCGGNGENGEAKGWKVEGKEIYEKKIHITGQELRGKIRERKGNMIKCPNESRKTFKILAEWGKKKK